ncbi:MAG: hypothetical protein OEZ30_08065 [Candidatus Aminicenantes bacterium]|nr:hypothetical protein [Candidatus Aminicenantes bacterium]
MKTSFTTVVRRTTIRLLLVRKINQLWASSPSVAHLEGRIVVI